MAAPIIESLKNQIKEIQAKIEKIQEDCSHPPLVLQKIHKSNTGNYDPSNDSYWIDFHCQLCDKRWRQDQ